MLLRRTAGSKQMDASCVQELSRWTPEIRVTNFGICCTWSSFSPAANQLISFSIRTLHLVRLSLLVAIMALSHVIPFAPWLRCFPSFFMYSAEISHFFVSGNLWDILVSSPGHSSSFTTCLDFTLHQNNQRLAVKLTKLIPASP